MCSDFLIPLFLYPLILPTQVDTIWVRRWTGAGALSDWAYAIAVDSAGFVYVTGTTENSATANDWTTIKYTPDGDTVWVRHFISPGNYNERASCITIGNSGSIYITGYTMSSGSGDYLTIKYQPDGDTAWTRRYNGTGNGYDFAHWISVDDQENVYVAGYSRGSSYQEVITDNNYVYVLGYVNPYNNGTRYDYMTIKYNGITGETLWARTYNGADSSDIGVDSNGNVYVTGSSRLPGHTDIVTIKYDAYGNQQWIAQYDNPDTSGSNYFPIHSTLRSALTTH